MISRKDFAGHPALPFPLSFRTSIILSSKVASRVARAVGSDARFFA